MASRVDVLRLRSAGLGWKRIARLLDSSPSVVRRMYARAQQGSGESGAEEMKRRARSFRNGIFPVLRGIVAGRTVTVADVKAELERRGVRTAQGLSAWQAVTVGALLREAGLSKSRHGVRSRPRRRPAADTNLDLEPDLSPFPAELRGQLSLRYLAHYDPSSWRLYPQFSSSAR